MQRSALAFVGLCVVYAATATAQTTPPATSRPAAVHLELHVNPFVDLHFFVRACAAGTAEVPAIDGFDQAVQAARDLDRTLGGPLAWGFIEAVLSTCATAAEARDACPRVPERFRTRRGQIVELRAGAARLVEAYAAVEEAFRTGVWPEHHRACDRAAQRIRDDLLPKQRACFEEICARLALPDPGAGIPVYLVAKAPPPGASTHRRGGLGVCFVSVDGADRSWSLLYEAVLHESIHAIDVAAQGQPTVFADLKRRLIAAGVGPRHPANRDAAHTVVFVQAAETVRRRIDPAHEHHGDVRGYYERVGDVAGIVRRSWTMYLDDQIARDEALDRIVREVAGGAAGSSVHGVDVRGR